MTRGRTIRFGQPLRVFLCLLAAVAVNRQVYAVPGTFDDHRTTARLLDVASHAAGGQVSVGKQRSEVSKLRNAAWPALIPATHGVSVPAGVRRVVLSAGPIRPLALLDGDRSGRSPPSSLPSEL